MESKTNSKINSSYFLKLILLIVLPAVILISIAKYIFPSLDVCVLSIAPISILIMGTWAYYLFKKIEENPSRMTAIHYINMGLKLLLSLIVIVIIALTSRGSLIAFVAIYFILYLILLVFETKSMIKAGKIENKN